MAPSEFWGMHPQEFWWVYEAKLPPDARENVNAKWKELYDLLD